MGCFALVEFFVVFCVFLRGIVLSFFLVYANPVSLLIAWCLPLYPCTQDWLQDIVRADLISI